MSIAGRQQRAFRVTNRIVKGDKVKRYFSTLSLAILLVGSSRAIGAEKKEVQFGALEATSNLDAHEQASAWLRTTGKTDAATMERFEAIWRQEDRTVLDMVADTLALGDAGAAKLLADARDLNAPAPVKVPDILKDAKNSSFFREFGACLCPRPV